MATIMISWNREELEGLQTMIIVENWRRIDGGKGKRKYKEEFTDQERDKIRRLYNTFYKWHLVRGVPEKHVFKTETINLIKRAVNFFATV